MHKFTECKASSLRVGHLLGETFCINRNSNEHVKLRIAISVGKFGDKQATLVVCNSAEFWTTPILPNFYFVTIE